MTFSAANYDVGSVKVTCASLTLHDSSEAPLHIQRVLAGRDRASFLSGISLGLSAATFYSESSMPIGAAKVALGADDQDRLRVVWSNPEASDKPTYDDMEAAYEQFLCDILSCQKGEVPLAADFVQVSLTVTETGPTSDKSAGTIAEDVAEELLSSTFRDACFRSPFLISGNDRKELTDFLCYSTGPSSGEFPLPDPLPLCIFEVKSIEYQTPDRASLRRVSKIEKSLDKALAQIRRAAKALRGRREILDDRTSERIAIGDALRDGPYIGIIVVPELLGAIDWQFWLPKLNELSEDEELKVLCQVIDHGQLQNFSRLDPERFVGALLMRWLKVKETGKGFARVTWLPE